MSKRTKTFSYTMQAGNSDDLGVTRDGERLNFAIAVPSGKSCMLLLYRKGGAQAEARISMEERDDAGEIRAVCLEGLPVGELEYTYQIDGLEVQDPYAKAFVRYEEGAVMRGRIPDFLFDWEEDKPLRLPIHTCMMYSVHARGFTMHPSSGVEHRGTFAGIKERIPYLKELGINQLELMPIYEPCKFDTENYWGYEEGFYFAPRASYAFTEDPMRELKDLVKVLHQAGIELILDFHFPSGIGYRNVYDCVRYWVKEYHIDGVHITGEGGYLAALSTEPSLGKTRIYGEGVGRLTQYDDRFLKTARRLLRSEEGQVGVFAELVRRNVPDLGVVNYICSHDGFTLMDLVSYEEKRNEANREANRDGTDFNYSWNCGFEGHCEDQRIQSLRLQQRKNALAMVFLSQGVPMLYGGDECGNSQEGNNNAYCQDNELGWICWENGEDGTQLFQFVKQLIAFRKAHPVLHQRTVLREADDLCSGLPEVSYHGTEAWYGSFGHGSRRLGVLYHGAYVAAETRGAERDDVLYVAYNFHGTEQIFALPDLPEGKRWHLALDTAVETDACFREKKLENEEKELRTWTSKARSVVVLIGK